MKGMKNISVFASLKVVITTKNLDEFLQQERARNRNDMSRQNPSRLRVLELARMKEGNDVDRGLRHRDDVDPFSSSPPQCLWAQNEEDHVSETLSIWSPAKNDHKSKDIAYKEERIETVEQLSVGEENLRMGQTSATKLKLLISDLCHVENGKTAQEIHNDNRSISHTASPRVHENSNDLLLKLDSSERQYKDQKLQSTFCQPPLPDSPPPTQTLWSSANCDHDSNKNAYDEERISEVVEQIALGEDMDRTQTFITTMKIETSDK